MSSPPDSRQVSDEIEAFQRTRVATCHGCNRWRVTYATTLLPHKLDVETLRKALGLNDVTTVARRTSRPIHSLT